VLPGHVFLLVLPPFAVTATPPTLYAHFILIIFLSEGQAGNAENSLKNVAFFMISESSAKEATRVLFHFVNIWYGGLTPISNVLFTFYVTLTDFK
jgi:hypothetical protein